MHELSIAASLIDAANEEVLRQGVVIVRTLHVRVGQLSGVVPDALRFAFDVAVEGTPIAGASLVIEESEGRELEFLAMEVADAGADC
jgi:hydrogenase nickel incorporation protein HypA/HybF